MINRWATAALANKYTADQNGIDESSMSIAMPDW